MNLSDRAQIQPQVIARQVGDETVMLDLANGMYFSLDAIGARIWQLLGEGRTLAEICAAITVEYEVARDVIERDVLNLVEELAAHGLLAPA
jgi:hypothetical protein